MSENALVIRADADIQMGTGHLMRCLALGQAWKDAGGQVVFITACAHERLLQRLHDEHFVVRRLKHPYPNTEDWWMTERLLGEHPEAWLVLDGYHFNSAYQRRVKEAGHRLMVIDDMAHLPYYSADIVLNQNIHAKALRYSCEPYTRPLFGTKYVLLRREFLAWRGWRREIPEVARKVLVTLGGSDPDNVTITVIHALQQVETDGFEARVVVGTSNPYYEKLQAAVRGSQIRLERHITNMPDLMAWADVAVSAAGSTCWELAFMGVPFMMVILAANQKDIAKRLEEAGVALNAGWHTSISTTSLPGGLTNLLEDLNARFQMSFRGRSIVDGLGAGRVIDLLDLPKDRESA